MTTNFHEIYKMTGEGSKLSKREGKVRVSVNLITQFEIIGKKLYLPILGCLPQLSMNKMNVTGLSIINS